MDCAGPWTERRRWKRSIASHRTAYRSGRRPAQVPAIEPSRLNDNSMGVPPLSTQPNWACYGEMEEVAPPRQVQPSAGRKKPGLEVLRRVGTKELCRITRQLSALLHAGMPLVPALSALVEQLQSPTGTKTGKDTARPIAQVMERVRDEA